MAVNPVWSPDGSLIAYGGPLVAGQTALGWVRPDGTSADLPAVRVRPGGYRFLPDGKGLVFQPTGPAPDFWLLNLMAKTTRQLTHLSDRGRIQTFDIAPDGKAIVFDRIRENSESCSSNGRSETRVITGTVSRSCGIASLIGPPTAGGSKTFRTPLRLWPLMPNKEQRVLTPTLLACAAFPEGGSWDSHRRGDHRRQALNSTWPCGAKRD